MNNPAHDSGLAVILPAAGSSTRFGGPVNKLLANLSGQTVFARTIQAFLCRNDVQQLIVVTSGTLLQDDVAPNLAQLLHDPRITICPGGPSRAHSVRAGLSHIHESIQWVAVHDAARPLISQQLIDRTISAAHEHSAAVPALSVALTIKQATGPLPAPVQRTIPRDGLFAMQTPQIMQRSALEHGFDHCPIPLTQVTDDVQLLELTGQPVWLVEGDQRNIKITTRFDLKLAELYLSGAAAD